MKKDFLDEVIEESTAEDPLFPELLRATRRTRELIEALTERRKELGLSQTKVAAAMDTSQSVVARLEKETYDTHLSTIARYAAAVGVTVEFKLVGPKPNPKSKRRAA